MHAHSTFVITKAALEEGRLEGIASTPSPDRVGDVVEPRGAIFRLPLPLLWQHDTHEPIGHVTEARVTANGIAIVATVARSVTSAIAERWALIKSGLVRGLSIGFRGLKSEPMKGGGLRFKEWELLEISAVTIAANSEATILSVKAADREMLLRQFWARIERGESVADLPYFNPANAHRPVNLSR